MSDLNKISIVLYGEILEKDSKHWWEWYEWCKNFGTRLGYTPNYIGIRGESFKSGKVLKLNRVEKRFKKSIEQNEYVENLDLYALPEEFSQAVFDYRTHMCINRISDEHIILITLPSKEFENINLDTIINDMKRFMDITKGEVFEMSVLNCPYFYAMKVNSPSDYETLKIIKQF
ncbi:hypothetical protein MUG87_08875 [Ectobacillus sp. JY-23]|uniref:hypothetical protein n=1 Tax=Ectobacillus sp. JY-23 TaxID=2933872 RepID=UPI001FF19A9A|nr:hypothetical protein [Ectobacillus sp. JY-23]UOY94193.1 hypothetical protein MUG87_08875 [Ectobacillus sp. JY-23]